MAELLSRSQIEQFEVIRSVFDFFYLLSQPHSLCLLHIMLKILTHLSLILVHSYWHNSLVDSYSAGDISRLLRTFAETESDFFPEPLILLLFRIFSFIS